MKRALPANASHAPFDSLDALQKAHLALSAEADEIERSELAATDANRPALLAGLRRQVVELRWRASRFELKAAATGVLLDEPADRKLVQSILDYWCVRQGYFARLSERAAAAEGRTRRPPQPRLDPLALATFDPVHAPELGEGQCPFPGLSAILGDEEKATLEGRSAAIAELVQLIDANRFVIVSGPSGAGKSSLVHAGLVPALRAGAVEGSGTWTYWPAIVPGTDPVAALLGAVRPAGAEPGTWVALRRPMVEQRPEALVDIVAEVDAQRWPSLLVVDQGGELFAMAPAETWKPFGAALAALARVPFPRHRILLVVRDDFLERFLRLDGIAAMAEPPAVYRLPPMSASELRAAIEGPAATAGLRFDPGIVDDLVRELVGEPAPLPLLQFALLQLWARRERNRITFSAYREMGPPATAVARVADGVFEDLDEGEQDLARRLFLALLSPFADDEIVRRRLPRAALHALGDAGDIDKVLERFERAGLMRRATGETADQDRFEVVHEALLRYWRRLADWLDARKATNHRQLLVLNRARLWDSSERQSDYLAAGEALKEAAEFETEDRLIADYVSASRAHEQRRRRRLGAILSGAGLVFAAMLIALVALSILIKRSPMDLVGGLLPIDAGEESQVDLPRLERDGPGATGYVLVGTDGQTLITDALGRRAVAVDEVVALGAYRLRIDSPLHGELPQEGAATPAGMRAAHDGLILALGAPTPVTGAGGTQYWLNVRLIPRIQVRYPGTGVERVNAVSAALRESGFDVSPAEAVPTPVLKPLITFYHSQDRDAALALSARLEQEFDGPVQVQDRSAAGRLADPGTLEVWLDVAGARSTASNRNAPDG